MILPENDWGEILRDEFKQPYFKDLQKFLEDEYKIHTVYPKKEQIFEALNHTSFKNTKVLILGQDPYKNEGQAHGMAFSVQKGAQIPPSLKNIFKEIENTLSVKVENDGNLEGWAKQGVLLLNTILTIRAGLSLSHSGKGWEKLTDFIIYSLSKKTEPMVFILWGNYAKSKIKLIQNPNHLILQSAHPSPLSCKSFFGNNHFGKANDFLLKNGFDKIRWV